MYVITKRTYICDYQTNWVNGSTAKAVATYKRLAFQNQFKTFCFAQVSKIERKKLPMKTEWTIILFSFMKFVIKRLRDRLCIDSINLKFSTVTHRHISKLMELSRNSSRVMCVKCQLPAIYRDEEEKKAILP